MTSNIDDYPDPEYIDDETDEIALPRFEERLRARLAAAHDEANVRRDFVAAMVVPAAVETIDIAAPATSTGPAAPVGASRSGARPAAHRHPDRRRARRSLTVGVGAIAAAAAVVFGVTLGQPGDGGRPDGTDGDGASGATLRPTSELVPLIIAATDEAEATSVVHVTMEMSSGRGSESWIDETSGAGRLLQYGVAGEPVLDSSQRGTDTITVDHCFAEYAAGTSDHPRVPGSATPWVENGLADGTLVEDGTEVVDGRELIRLRKVPLHEVAPDSAAARRLREELRAAQEALREGRNASPPLPDREMAVLEAKASLAAVRAEQLDPPAPGEAFENGYTLVDPDTYRPVMSSSDVGYVMTYEYLPRTPENLAMLDAKVPEGFRETTDVRGDGERVDNGCT